MSMQQFCLRWNNHQPNFISVFSNLLTNETLVDVTLAAEGRQIQAHKVVLSACSTYFQSLFTMNPCQHPIVILKDIKFSDLKIMVDFMYYGEVNISQDQLPSIIKTAESLKIKGLAEMHTASLTKWPSGSSETGGGDRGESCSPSPSPLSPSFRRKRLRKSSTGSTSGSGDKPEEINEITLVATNIVKPEPLIVSQDSGENLRRPVNTSTESQGSIDEDQISIMSNMETSSANTPAQSDGSLQDVSQQSAGNIGQSSVSSQPSTHQGIPWTIMEHTYPRFALSSCQTNLSIQASSAFTTPEITASSTISDQYSSGTSTTGSSCALTNYPNSSHGTLQHTSSGGPSPSAQCPSNCQSPCASPQTAIKRKRSTNPQADENFIRALDAVRYGGIGFCKAARMFGVNNRTLWLEYKKRGYPNNRPSLKSRVKQEVNSSPPPPAPPAQPMNSQSPTPMGPPTTPHSTHNTHSTHTMLTSHSPHTMLSGYIDSRHTDYALPTLHCKQTQVTKRTRLLIRQPRVKKEPSHLSPDGEAGPSPHIVSTSIHLATPTLNLPQTSRSFEESRISPPPHTMLVSHQPNLLTVTTSSNLLTVPQPSYLTKQHSHPLLSTQQPSTSGTYWIHRQHSHPDPLPGRTTSPSIVIEPAPVLKTEEEGYEETSVPILSGTVSEPGTSGISSGGISGGLRVKTTELRRASSSPQSSSSSREPRESAGDQRLGHCPVLRQGPALGCNHCWNTVDDRGRILRRKTKYHCPECQINLCIVPCFQEFHEQQRELNSKLKPLPKTSSV
ncbi:mucin-5AC [Ooceraea biroi]|uniref:mucin-5AC n=1 Tax=Ooceraea biroi TaxID=2015173 RepID=UPI000F0781B5|nr:mucin-5AC [Ooceraea biroi]